MPTFKSRRPANAKRKPGQPGGKMSNQKGGGGKGPRPGAKRPVLKKKPSRPAGAQTSIENTGREINYLRHLTESGKTVVVVLNTGENLRGVIRYYDRDVFSLGPSDGGPKIFLRKDGIKYLYEEE